MKIINDIYRLGRTDPVVHSYLNLVERNEMTLEQALIGMVCTLTEQKNEVTHNFCKHLEKCDMPALPEQTRGGLVRPDGGDYPLKWMGKGD